MSSGPRAPALPRRRLLLAGAALAGGCSSPGSQTRTTPTSGAAAGAAFDDWADRFAADWVRVSPERAQFAPLLPAAEQRQLERRLTPRTEAQREREFSLARRGLAEAGRHLAAPLPAAQRVSAETVSWSLARAVDGHRFRDHRFMFDQGGLQVSLVNRLGELHPLRDRGDADNWLALLEQVPQRIDEGLGLSRAAVARGLLPPRFIVERSRAQVESLLRAPADDNPLVAGLARRSEGVAALAATRQRTIADARRLVEQHLRPAYTRLNAWLDELHPRCGTDAGWWRLPEGEAAYRQALKANTTTELDAEEIHRIGLDEVARIEGEIDRVLRRMGRHEGSVKERADALRLATRLPAEPDPRPELLRRYAAAVHDAELRSRALFRLQPKAPVEVRRVPGLTERTSSAYYTTPMRDGSRPGVFWVPLPGPVFNTLGMRSLAVHEAVPGHHFQLALQQEMSSLPRWRQLRVFAGGSAHSEGWALYAERLAIEQGWYDDDLPSLVGAWEAQLFRARRLVVDTGLHTKRWTREQAIAYGISASEVERYVSNPGQACAYMIGMKHILALRDRARTSAGARFSLVDFHDLVLATGSVPLAVLSRVVDDWARERRG